MKKWNAIWKQFVTYVEGHLIEKINISLKLKIIVITKENRGPALLVSNLKYKEHRDVPVWAYNSSRYVNHLILPRKQKSSKSVILCFDENTKSLIFFFCKERFEKEKSNVEFFYKNYSLRLIDSARFMNNSLDSLVDNLTRSIYNTKWKYCIKYKYCKRYEKCKDDNFQWCEMCKSCKKNYKIIF